MPRLSPLIPLVGLLALAACGGRSSAPVLMREPSVPVRSIAGFDLQRIGGTWQQMAALAPNDASCAKGQLRATPEAGAMRLQGQLCLGGRMVPIHSLARPSGPGRLQLSGQAADWWVIWADWDMRTLVLADPKGSFAVVLDRGQISADRMKAAREMLEFNGYTVSALR